ncbi:MAG: hypothetical protein JW748_08670 [Anaerolineales bacterium]|nr:hypothetical protein [Anaerolineales bacterium]
MGNASGSVDTQAPFINGSLSGIAGNGGRFVSAVEVPASAGGATSGIGSIVYSLDGAPQAAYTGPFSAGDGTHSIVFTATGIAGNGSSQNVHVNVDTGQPAISIDPVSGTSGDNGWFASSATVSASAGGGISGIALPQYSVDGGPSAAYAGPVAARRNRPAHHPPAGGRTEIPIPPPPAGLSASSETARSPAAPPPSHRGNTGSIPYLLSRR